MRLLRPFLIAALAGVLLGCGSEAAETTNPSPTPSTDEAFDEARALFERRRQLRSMAESQ
jgi:hypothetical protein